MMYFFRLSGSFDHRTVGGVEELEPAVVEAEIVLEVGLIVDEQLVQAHIALALGTHGEH